MSALAGYLTTKSWPAGLAESMLDQMAGRLRYAPTDKLDCWEDGNIGIVRLHHGRINHKSQPILSADGRFALFLSGEIYDYDWHKEELQKQGCCSQDIESDAEYFLQAYLDLGDKLFSRLNGSFLAVIFDRRQRTLTLVNDRFSSHPLFYYRDSGIFIFGTQMRPILEWRQVPRVIDRTALAEYFTFQKIFAERTFFKDISMAPPGSVVEVSNGGLQIKSYWQPHYSLGKGDEQEYAERLAEALRTAANRRSRDRLRKGILLSGGLDSRAVLAALDGRVTAFTLGEYQNNEVKTAEQLARIKGCEFVFVERKREHYSSLLNEAVDIGDGMFGFAHAHFLGAMAEIGTAADVLFHGHGLDVTFQGMYLPYRNLKCFGKDIPLPILDRPSLRNLSKELIDNLGYSLGWEQPHLLFRTGLREDYYRLISSDIDRLITGRSEIHSDDPLNAWDYFNVHNFYKHYTHLNFTCVQAYVDERTLMYDNDLFNLYLEMPARLRASAKIFHRAIALLDPRIAAVANANTNLPPKWHPWLHWGGFMAKAMARRIRMTARRSSGTSPYLDGSWPNLGELFRQNSELRLKLKAVSGQAGGLPETLFDMGRVRHLTQAHLDGREDHVWTLMLLLTFSNWYQKYV